MIGLIGRKVGMSRLFVHDDNLDNLPKGIQAGTSIPVTLVYVEENRVVQKKTVQNDGYRALQLSTGEKKVSKINLPTKGHFKASLVVPGIALKEFRVTEEQLKQFTLGETVPLSLFKSGDIIDVTGISKGKGFAGTVKRWNFSMQPASHGNSLSRRVPGSTGQNQTPARVFKGKKLPGHLGCERVTEQGLQLLGVDMENSLLIIRGSIPGASGSLVTVSVASNHKPS